MTTEEAIRLLLNHLNVANQIEDRLNRKRVQWRINTTQMLVLVELTSPSGGRVRAELRAASASELAARLHQSRARISVQLKELSGAGFVEQVEFDPLVDQRSRRFKVTPAGVRMANDVREHMVLLSKVICVSLDHRFAPCFVKAMKLLVDKLPDAPEMMEVRTVNGFRQDTIRARKAAALKRKAQ